MQAASPVSVGAQLQGAREGAGKSITPQPALTSQGKQGLARGQSATGLPS